MNLDRMCQLAQHTPISEPVGLTMREALDFNSALRRNEQWPDFRLRLAAASGDLRILGRRIVIIPDDWEHL